jgi:lysophospholipase L1-like esterase
MNRRGFLAGVGAVLLAGCMPADPRQRVVIIGDSTAAFYRRSKGPIRGWGQMLPEWLKGRATVWNRAVPGASSRSFAADHWRTVRRRLRRGDVLLIQFGHNDAARDARRHTEPFGGYAALLASFAGDARLAGARPVFVTPIPRWRFFEGRVADTHGAYLTAMREVADQTGVPLIDLHAAAAAAMERLGPDASRAWFMAAFDARDNVHLSAAGARAMARLVAGDLSRLGLVGAVKG